MLLRPQLLGPISCPKPWFLSWRAEFQPGDISAGLKGALHNNTMPQVVTAARRWSWMWMSGCREGAEGSRTGSAPGLELVSMGWRRVGWVLQLWGHIQVSETGLWRVLPALVLAFLLSRLLGWSRAVISLVGKGEEGLVFGL